MPTGFPVFLELHVPSGICSFCSSAELSWGQSGNRVHLPRGGRFYFKVGVKILMDNWSVVQNWDFLKQFTCSCCTKLAKVLALKGLIDPTWLFQMAALLCCIIIIISLSLHSRTKLNSICNPFYVEIWLTGDDINCFKAVFYLVGRQLVQLVHRIIEINRETSRRCRTTDRLISLCVGVFSKVTSSKSSQWSRQVRVGGATIRSGLMIAGRIQAR